MYCIGQREKIVKSTAFVPIAVTEDGFDADEEIDRPWVTCCARWNPSAWL